MAEETRYFNNYIIIPSAGNWSIIAINPHAYAITLENDRMAVEFPNTLLFLSMGVGFGGFVLFAGVRYAIKRRKARKLGPNA